MAIARPLFLPHRDGSYVATQPLRWKGKELGPGDAVPADWPEHHLRHLHRLGRIGAKDHPWTEARIEAWELKLERGRERQAERTKGRIAQLTRVAEEADAEAKELMAEAEGARSIRDRIAGLLGGGGAADGGPADQDDPAPA